MKFKKENLGYIEGWVSIVVNTLLFGMKYWVGILCGSVAMIADAWHTLSDTLTSIVVIVGFVIAARPADKEHPFGHGRAEFIAALAIGILLGVVGFNFMAESVGRLIHHHSVKFSLFAIIVFFVSIFVKEALSQFAFWAGKQINSKSVTADGWHHRSDAIASALIVVGALFGKFFWWIDGVLGIGVSLLILWAAFDIIRSSSSALLGEAADRESEKKIRNLILKNFRIVKSTHHIHIHRYGTHNELTLHIKLPSSMSVARAHDICTEVEVLLKREMKMETTVHVEPA